MSKKSEKEYRFATKAIHSGQDPDPSTGAVIGPIYATSTYAQETPGQFKGFDYSRTANPTRQSLEECMADLEGGSKAFAFASGMAATATVLELLDSGDHIISMDDLYGGTYRLFENVRKRSSNLDFSFVDLSNIENLKENLKPKTKMIWVESPSNPLLKVVDLKRVSAFARENNLLCVCDNTFCSPFVQRPLDLGFDIVVHSATKYLNGHSDVVGGVAICSHDNIELGERLGFLSNSVGSIMGPFDSFLVLRSLKTLSLRMKQHCQSASDIARFLYAHGSIDKVYYPGLEEHPNHEIAKKQMTGFGAVISFELNKKVNPKTFLKSLKMINPSMSFAGVESTMLSPAETSHYLLTPEDRLAQGITDNLIRFSVGIEDVPDIQNDIEQAFNNCN